jgi:hypothetical protein
MGYFDNFDNEFLNKYKKKSYKWKINYKCVLILLDWGSFKFHSISLSFDSLSKTIKFYVICNGSNLTFFDGLSNNNEIVWNLNDHQSKGRRIHL